MRPRPGLIFFFSAKCLHGSGMVHIGQRFFFLRPILCSLYGGSNAVLSFPAMANDGGGFVGGFPGRFRRAADQQSVTSSLFVYTRSYLVEKALGPLR